MNLNISLEDRPLHLTHFRVTATMSKTLYGETVGL